MNSSIWTLLWHAGWVGKGVLLVLSAISVLCWAVILTKHRRLKQLEAEDKKFLDIFWNGKNLEEIAMRAETVKKSPIAQSFRSGLKELKKLASVERTDDGGLEIESIGRSLQKSSQKEILSLEKDLSWLATTASSAPFIGLFGTVWGILSAFQQIGATGTANLAVIAPAIAEALITTAAGIFAAIPATIAYNYFLQRIKRTALEMDNFSQDFLNIIQRSFLTGSKKK